jgi:hypothetical protein
MLLLTLIFSMFKSGRKHDSYPYILHALNRKKIRETITKIRETEKCTVPSSAVPSCDVELC